MTTTILIESLRKAKVVPVVRMQNSDHARTAVYWLREAGLKIFEITMTIPGAHQLIAELSSESDLIVGAGTVPDAEAAAACLAAGASFIVAPWIDPSLTKPCQAAGAALLLGAATPSEVRQALAAGADVVKIFPASSVGGPPHIKALASVFPGVPFCPTGGIGFSDIQKYLDAGSAFVGMGGSLVDEALVAANNKAAIVAAAHQIIAL